MCAPPPSRIATAISGSELPQGLARLSPELEADSPPPTVYISAVQAGSHQHVASAPEHASFPSGVSTSASCNVERSHFRCHGQSLC